MIGTLTRRIETICGAELSLLRRQLYALAWQDMHQGAIEGVATAMARKPSCVDAGVSVEVVCFARRPTADDPAVYVISVAMHVHPDRQSGVVYWDEADAWALAVAGNELFRVEPRGGLEKAGSRIFHYALYEEAPLGEAVPLYEATTAAPCT